MQKYPQGAYSRTGSMLNGPLQLIIAQRKVEAVTKSKPRNYLLRKYPTNERRYFSSMYPTEDPRVFRIEKGGRWFRLHLSEYDATIQPEEPEGEGVEDGGEHSSYVYKLELVSKGETATEGPSMPSKDSKPHQTSPTGQTEHPKKDLQ